MGSEYDGEITSRDAGVAVRKSAAYLATEYKSEEMAREVRNTIKLIETAPAPSWRMIGIAEYLKQPKRIVSKNI